MFKRSLFIGSLSVVFLVNSAAIAANSSQVPAIVVKKNEKTGEFQIPDNFAGSATYISPKEIEERQTNDIQRIVAQVPGINIQEEDGYGLRPNIGIRGSGNDRSANITLMEDGVLIAPAPYSAPAAYYFPSMGRVKGIEVRKGSSSIKYGPRTTSGALNLITTQIPEFSRGSFTGSLGNYDEKNFNINYGDSAKNYGYVVNFDQQSSDGFKELDGGQTNGGSANTGYNLTDFITKFRINTDKNADIYQALEFKVGINDELSHETYVGLDLGDFVNNPYRRYRGSALDNMEAEHRQYELKHYIEPNKKFNLTTTAYYHEFDRNWYKLNKVDGVKLADIFNDTSTYASELSALKGDGSGTLEVKANKRNYVSQGIQSIANTDIKFSKNHKHNLEYGIRYHADYEDRLQHADDYTIDSSGVIKLSAAGTAGDAGNRVNSTRALSTFIEDEIELGKLTIVLGVRFEHIDLKRKDYNNASDRNSPADTTKTSEDVIVPGIATSYKLGNDLNIFAGVHKGFAPAAPGNQAESEESINYEVGTRYRTSNNLFLETVLFFNDYDNLLGEEVGSLGDQYNGGAVDVKGLEFATSYEAKAKILGRLIKFPLLASYTYTKAEFKTSFTSDLDEWGSVTSGDEVPYIAPHQLTMAFGTDFDKFSFNLSNKFVSAMRTVAGKGSIAKNEKIASHFITDFVGFYEFKPDQNIFFAIDNIFDKQYAVAARPAGLRPGKPLTARVGFKVNF